MGKKAVGSQAPVASQRRSLQRLPSPTLYGPSPILHFLQLSAHLASFRYLSTNPTPINDSYGWHFQYLTILGLTLSTITALLGSLSDILSPYQQNSTSSASHTLFKWQKSVLFGVTAPLEILVTCLYWSLRIIDKDLVIPEWAQLPLIPDLSFHILPTLCLLSDALLLSPPSKSTPRQAFLTSTLIAFAYYPWVERCNAKNGYYPYPIFELVGFYGRIGLFALSALVMAGNAGLLRWAYAMVNGVEGDDGRPRVLHEGTGNGAMEVAMGEGKDADALRQLKESVNGTLRRRGELVGQDG